MSILGARLASEIDDALDERNVRARGLSNRIHVPYGMSLKALRRRRLRRMQSYIRRRRSSMRKSYRKRRKLRRKPKLGRLAKRKKTKKSFKNAIMPYYRKRRTRRRRSSIGTRIINKLTRYTKAQERWERLAPLFNTGTVIGQRMGPEGYSDYTAEDYVKGLIARGRGAYGLGRLGRAIGSRVGRAFGSRKAGAAVGGFLGRNALKMAGVGGYVAGNGEYSNASGSEAAVNGLIAGSNSSVPTMQGGDEIGSVVLTHKECLGTVTGSVAFENTTFELNPGLKGTFPFASQIASNYQEYAFLQLQFTYISLLSEATNSGTVGNIIITTDYNAGNEPYYSSIDMLNNIGTVSARPIDGPIIHGVECDPSKNVLSSMYVRTGSVPAGQDKKTYDLGTTQLATEGMPNDGQIVGQWWVSYQLLLRKPVIYVSAGKNISQFLYKFSGDPEGQRKNTMAGTLGRVDSTNNLDLTIENYYPNYPAFKITFPPTIVQGLYELIITIMNPHVGNGGYPSYPAMAPDYQLSNITIPADIAKALYPDVWVGGQEPIFGQSYGGFSKSVEYKFPLKLMGSFAIPTTFLFMLPDYGTGNFMYDEFQIRVHAINPLFTATSENNPPEWLPYAPGTIPF